MTQQKQHTAAEIRVMLRDAIEYSKREDEKDGDKTSNIQLIMIAIDMFSLFSIRKSTRLVLLLLLRFLALQKWHAQYALTTMKRLITRRISTTLSRPTTYHQQNTLPIPTLNIKSRCTSFKLPMCYLMIFTKTHISRMEDDFHPIFS